ncbi:methyltransferase [Algimonas ampicilliniresistens]|uniref:Methyltransferase n=1 Tax=Algimonas ampicilliniresistens TaxID=1298735 RepID=A0ABQ5V646_9PROT|nr:DNA methyltransferase [Algimonas ampicilliniresistens]GLQ22555.1 methyltransferase [Algimonas ampicilliniresistens]
MSNLPHPKIEMVPTDSLIPNPRNARRHPDHQISKLALTIATVGWLVPIIIDDNNVIVAGHGRLLVALKLGHREVPCIRAKFVTEADKRAFALAENRIPELSTTDKSILNDELLFVFEDKQAFESTGYSVGDIDFSVTVPSQAPEAEEVSLPDPNTYAVSRVGDLWQIGPHRIYCGDARSVDSWERLLGDDRADIVFADPPYNVPIDGHVSGNGKNKHREFVMGAGEMNQAEFTSFLRIIARNCVRFSKNGSIHYIAMDWRHCRELLDAADGVYTEHKQIVVWVKTNGGQGAFYRSQHEFIFVFKSGKAKHINNFKLGETGRYRTNVVEYAGANTFRKGRDEDLAAHSTVKPTALVMDFLLDCSHAGGLVVDPCLGSGTTLLAALHTGRRGAGMELDPLYCDTALQRLSVANGLTPILDGDGRSFEEIKTERLGMEATHAG